MSYDSDISPRRHDLDLPGRYGLIRLILKRVLACIDRGDITIVTPSGGRFTHRGHHAGHSGVLVLHRWRALRRLISGGDLGLAEAYIAGDWSSPDVMALIALGADNSQRLDQHVAALPPIRLFNRLRHLLRTNSRAGSRRNIAFHYDLGNAFYRLWLDSSMTYSSAIYDRPGQSLESAQQAKLDRIVERLNLAAGHQVLEIGCGWGALARRMGEAGAQVTGLTLSAEQLGFARDLMIREKLSDRVLIKLQDYRDTTGRFDRIVSIEMLEAVGEAYWPQYFQTLRRCLKAGGSAVLQVITIHEDRFETYRKGADFIQRHIFPGGMLPTRAIIAEQAAAAGLALESVEGFGTSYALTLAEWRRRFLAALPEVTKLGFNEQFHRLWEYYLCYCEAGFRTGAIDVGLYYLKG